VSAPSVPRRREKPWPQDGLIAEPNAEQSQGSARRNAQPENLGSRSGRPGTKSARRVPGEKILPQVAQSIERVRFGSPFSAALLAMAGDARGSEALCAMSDFPTCRLRSLPHRPPMRAAARLKRSATAAHTVICNPTALAALRRNRTGEQLFENASGRRKVRSQPRGDREGPSALCSRGAPHGSFQACRVRRRIGRIAGSARPGLEAGASLPTRPPACGERPREARANANRRSGIPRRSAGGALERADQDSPRGRARRGRPGASKCQVTKLRAGASRGSPRRLPREQRAQR